MIALAGRKAHPDWTLPHLPLRRSSIIQDMPAPRYDPAGRKAAGGPAWLERRRIRAEHVGLARHAHRQPPFVGCPCQLSLIVPAGRTIERLASNMRELLCYTARPTQSCGPYDADARPFCRNLLLRVHDVPGRHRRRQAGRPERQRQGQRRVAHRVGWRSSRERWQDHRTQVHDAQRDRQRLSRRSGRHLPLPRRPEKASRKEQDETVEGVL